MISPKICIGAGPYWNLLPGAAVSGAFTESSYPWALPTVDAWPPVIDSNCRSVICSFLGSPLHSASVSDARSSRVRSPSCAPAATISPTRLLVPDQSSCGAHTRSEEHTSELESLLRISYAVFCLKKKQPATSTIQHK